jgi:hypothetical protein
MHSSFVFLPALWVLDRLILVGIKKVHPHYTPYYLALIASPFVENVKNHIDYFSYHRIIAYFHVIYSAIHDIIYYLID